MYRVVTFLRSVKHFKHQYEQPIKPSVVWYMDSCSLSPSFLRDITLSLLVTNPRLSKNDLWTTACQANSAGILQFVLARIISMFVRTRLLFLSLPLVLALICQSSTLLSFSLSILSTYTCMHTCLFSRAHNGIHTRARTREHIHVHDHILFLITHASARTRTHTHTYSFLLFLSLNCKSVNVPYRVYDSWSSPCRAMEADRWHSSLLACTVTMIIP